MFSDGVVDLVEAGVITNEAKSIHRGKLIATFLMGSRRLYDFVDNNPAVEMHTVDYTNDPFVIGRNSKMVAINGALEVDLTGQVCADSIGFTHYSGVGGQVDFVRGAARSPGNQSLCFLHGGRGAGLAHQGGPLRGSFRYHHAQRCPLRSYRIRHCRPAGQEFPAESGSPYRCRPSRFSPRAERRGEGKKIDCSFCCPLRRRSGGSPAVRSGGRFGRARPGRRPFSPFPLKGCALPVSASFNR